jgi:uncharacterized protein YjbI with pentapeptide repeats
MNEENNKSQNENKPRRFNQQQYDLLKKCSDKKDMTEWNKWREEDGQDVFLEGGDFSNWYLKGVNLGTHREYGRDTPEVYLSKAKFNQAHLESAHLDFAHMKDVELHETHLEGARLIFTYLDNVLLLAAHLEGACLRCAKLYNTNVCNAHLNNADFVNSELLDSEFDNACLIGAKFRKTRVSGWASFCYCKVDHETDFREVGLDSIRIDSATKQLLEYNERRINWEEWYKEHPKIKWFFKTFWWISDYGLSEKRIVKVFLWLVFIFSTIYYLWGLISPTGIIDNLFVDRNGVQVQCWIVPLRTLYFSIITMTLGFSDMYAKAQSIWGHILITLQAILGYVLLGALVTRFAIMFTAGGPAGKFAGEKKN